MLQQAERKGAQTPRVKYASGDIEYSDGSDICMLASEFGLNLYDWQRDIVEHFGARDKSDKLSFTTCGLSVPRQNGKNAILEAYELYALCAGQWHILHTAHRVKTAKKSFQRLERYFTNSNFPELKALVKNIRYTNGEEAIYLTNGASIEFSARSRAGSRGFDDIQLVVFDEAQDLQDDQLSAVLYTLAASSTGERQLIYTGTPPDEKSPGTVFKRRRKAALEDNEKRSCWFEWSIEKAPPQHVKFEELIDLIFETNPSMGYVLDIEYTNDEFNNSDIEGFAVERLGWWKPSITEESCISYDLWKSTEIDEIANKFSKKAALGVKFNRDGTEYSLVGCKINKKGEAAIELIETGDTRQGTAGLASALIARKNTIACVVVDGVAGANVLCENLSRMKAPRGYIVRPNATDVITAATSVLDSLKEGSLFHTENEVLDNSALGCIRRDIGKYGGWGFGGTDLVDSEPIEAASLALWGVRNTRRDPKRKQMLL